MSSFRSWLDDDLVDPSASTAAGSASVAAQSLSDSDSEDDVPSPAANLIDYLVSLLLASHG